MRPLAHTSHLHSSDSRYISSIPHLMDLPLDVQYLLPLHIQVISPCFCLYLYTSPLPLHIVNGLKFKLDSYLCYYILVFVASFASVYPINGTPPTSP
ncbi:hypothetical protein BD309DRAFT_101906 [Dichomitus squalens]|uniref:Uncharacterized protein n=1 Tax=Dichomitus squalens TaxID=114155 RepID=A0A4Q9NRZ3_9APHY|nr:hypothetical protein BD311DRAFT_468128 [Dichomitus squalens]TBU43545.1 hypothetical protein BD309DRAFT_101906 [Dichomitus squalens]